ncbi:phosphotransferase family protein [Hoyosella subflava]|uniref:Kinase n=1 Tax=Hoyosella subflava (strain DSM 45089 / JCM 17490 / NBRC 109087 / DQS3-9A1) TaxID=443218 RepID=F6EMC6_HOYSD|nr:hypothetical protein [Hoyosella subflava]AEF40286.1 hypothetical protein AS9A_1837 [Hoyosella subflava DQS3-9A1]
MTALFTNSMTAVVAAAQRVLTKRYGVNVHLADPEDLGGSGQAAVLRVRVAESPIRLPRTLIIKQMWDSRASGVEGFIREAASYQFANSLARDQRPGPELLGHDLDQRLLILSDLGDARTLGVLLTGENPASATHLLMALAQALGRMHAATAGRADDFAALLRRARGTLSPQATADDVEAVLPSVPTLLSDVLGVSTPVEVVSAVESASQLLSNGSFRAFTPADLCPDNIVVSTDGVKFLDYEWGGFRDATLDLGCMLVSFPQCLCDLGLTVEQSDAMVEAWRAEIAGLWPQLLDDDVLYPRLLDARMLWVWLSTAWHLPEDYARRAMERDHVLAVPPAQALASRWAGLALAADQIGADAIADHADQVMDALNRRTGFTG